MDDLPEPEIIEQIDTIPGVSEPLPEEKPGEWGDPVEPGSPEVRSSTPHG